MSLINKMLKDLDNRTHPSPAYNPIYPSTIKPISRFPFKYILLLSLSCVAILSAMVMGVIYYKKIPTVKIIQPHLAETLAHTLPKASNPTWVQPTIISGLTIKNSDKSTDLIINLDHPVIYRLLANHENNTITLIFENATLRADSPLLDYTNTAIRTIATHVNQQQLSFEIYLNNEATLSYTNLVEDTNPPYIIVSFNQPTLTESDAPSFAKHDLVKTPAFQTILLNQYHLALQLAEQGKNDLAIKNLQNILRTDPAYHDARVSLIAILMSEKNTIEVSTLLTDGLAINPTYIPFLELKARALAASGKTSEALAVLQTSMPSILDNPDYHALMAALYERNNDDLLAVKLYKQLLSLDMQNGNWWFGLGLSLDKLGQTEPARVAFSHALAAGKLTTESALYLQNRLRALQENKDVGK